MSIGIAARHTLGGALFHGFMRIEYLQSTGTQYMLFTGLAIDGIDVMIRPPSSRNNVYGGCGAWNGGSRADTISVETLNDRGFTIKNADNTGYVFTGLPLAMRHVIVRGTDVTVDGNNYVLGKKWRNFAAWPSFALFGCWRSDTSVVTIANSCRIGPCILYSGATVVRDLYPVRIGKIGYFYDRLTKELIGNQGTGNFVLGPDVNA